MLWGLPGDPTMTAVRRTLGGLGVPALFLDQRQVLATTVEVTVGATVDGQVRVGGITLDLAGIGAAYLRPHDSTRVAAVRDAAPGSPAWRHAREVDDVLAAWFDMTSALVISRPSAAASNGSKPAQSREIAACGFSVPRTLVTNDPGAIEDFLDRNGPVVYKSTSAIRSRVRRLDRGDELPERLSGVTVCPTQFQRRVPGTDVRVHVAGAEVFATRITSDADDYRYAARQGLPRPRLDAIDLPDEIAERCSRLASRLGLPVAGVDLRVTPDGEWFCFEVNPSPAFSYYEAGTGQPIAAAVAGLIAAAVTCARVTR
jgi:RimK-like ATP-grasp domain